MSPETPKELPKGDPLQTIDRITKSVTSGKIDPHQLISDADFLLQVSGEEGKAKIQPFLREAVRRAPPGTMQTALIDRLTELRKKDLETNDQASNIRRYLQMGEYLGVSGTAAGQQFLDALDKTYPAAETSEQKRRREQLDDLVTRWGRYNTTLNENPADIDLRERQNLCEETAKLLTTSGLTEEQLLDLRMFSDKAMASVALATDRLGLKPLVDNERFRYELLEAGDLAPIYEAKQAADRSDELPDVSEKTQAYLKQLTEELQKAGQNNSEAVASLVRDWLSTEQPSEEPAIPFTAAQAAQQWHNRHHGGHLQQRVDLVGGNVERQREKHETQERVIPSYNRQIEALRDAPHHPEADSIFEDLATARFENTIDFESTSYKRRAQLLAFREHYIHSVSERIRNDLAQAVLRERLRPDEIHLPDQERESVLREVYRLVDTMIPEEERESVNKLFIELAEMGGLENLGSDNNEVVRQLDHILNLQGDESYQTGVELAQAGYAISLVDWADIIKRNQEAEFLLDQMYSSAPEPLQKDLGKVLTGGNGTNGYFLQSEWEAAGLDRQKWEAIQEYYDQSENYFDNLLKDRTTPLPELVYALIIANRSASIYSRELNKYEQVLSRYQHALAAQNDIKITVENGEVNLERVDIEEPADGEMEELYGPAWNEAEEFDKEQKKI